MAEYIITPENTSLPTGPYLMEELHRRGFPVEITLKGEADDWRSIVFFEEGPPEVKCTLSHDAKSGLFTISTTSRASLQSQDLQLFLVELLLQEVGGQADNTETRERYNQKQLSLKIKRLHGLTTGADIFWLCFSWAIVLFAVLMYFSVDPNLRSMGLVVLVLSSLGAIGLTISHFKS
jgi:hypothetical protein